LRTASAAHSGERHRKKTTHDEAADDHREQEERDADVRRAPDAVPHGLDPLAAQHAEHDHERAQEVLEVPARQLRKPMFRDRLVVVGAEHLRENRSFRKFQF